MIFSDSADELIGKWKTNTSYEFTLRLFQKKASQAPADIVKEWYAKLTLEQQTVCEIQNADEPLSYFSDGRLLWTEEPHPSAHKMIYDWY